MTYLLCFSQRSCRIDMAGPLGVEIEEPTWKQIASLKYDNKLIFT